MSTDADAPLITLRSGSGSETCEVVIDVRAGGRVRSVLIVAGDPDDRVELLADPGPAEPWSSAWGSFVMAPWAGRTRHGRFDVGGRTVALAVNHDDGDGTGVGGGPLHPPRPPLPAGELAPGDVGRHSIHGTTFARAWTVDANDGTRIEMSCPLVGALDWPFAGTASQVVEVGPRSVDFALAVTSDGESFPAALGWHPWFAKPDAVEFEPSAMYELDDIRMPTGRLVEPSPGPWDDCFVATGPARLRWDRPTAPVVTITSDCDHVVVFDRLGRSSCVEPQTGPPDSLNLLPVTVSPERPLRRTMRWEW